MKKIWRTLHQWITGMKLMTRVFLMTAAIIVVAIIALTLIIFNTLWQDYYENEIAFNHSAVINIKDYFLQKEDFVYKTVRGGLEDTPNRDGFGYRYIDLDADRAYDSDALKQLRSAFTAYTARRYAVDSNLTGIITYIAHDDSVYLESRTGTLASNVTPEDRNDLKAHMQKELMSITLRPAVYEQYSPGERSYSMLLNIRSASSFDVIGAIKVSFSTAAVSQFLNRYYADMKGEIVVLSDEGYVLYDSANQYYGMRARSIDDLRDPDRRSFISEERSAHMGLTVYGITTLDTLSETFIANFRAMALIAVAAILLVLIATFLFDKSYDRQLQTIRGAMVASREGNLSIRVPEGRYTSELRAFADSYNRTLDDLQAYIERAYGSELSKRQFQLLALQAQINPHFLYNTLEAIRMKALSSGVQEAAEMTYLLSRYLRGSIKEGPYATVAEEIDNCRRYLRLHEIRYADALSCSFDIPEELMECAMVRYTLQPIVENYIIHGFDITRADNRIAIKARQEKGMMFFTLRDNGMGMDAERLELVQNMLRSEETISIESIGLSNIHQRIRLLFGGDCGLRVESDLTGTTVVVAVKMTTMEELIDSVQSLDRR